MLESEATAEAEKGATAAAKAETEARSWKNGYYFELGDKAANHKTIHPLKVRVSAKTNTAK